jgi:hypothetical protein
MGKVKVTERTAMSAWMAMSDAEQLAAVAAYLGEQAAGRFVAHGRNRENQYSLADLAVLHHSQPAFPPDREPAGNWSGDELRAYIDIQDSKIAAKPKSKPRLRIDELNDKQLHQIATAATAEQVDTLLDEFTEGQSAGSSTRRT